MALASANHNSIARYWSAHFGFELRPDRCWACKGGPEKRLQRAHLICNGSGGMENLIILCCTCHAVQEKRPVAEVLLWVRDCATQDYPAPPWWREWFEKQAKASTILDLIEQDHGAEYATKLLARAWKLRKPAPKRAAKEPEPLSDFSLSLQSWAQRNKSFQYS